jgi:hypothetical protein
MKLSAKIVSSTDFAIKSWLGFTPECQHFSGKTMEAPIGTSNSATRFKDVISRNAPCISKAKRDERMDLLCFLSPETAVTEVLGSVHLEHGLYLWR